MMHRYLTPLLVVVTSLAVYFLYIDNAYIQITQKLATEQVIEGYLADAQQARTKLDKVIADYEAFPPNADARLRTLLPDTVDTVRLMVDVSAVAEKNGLALKSPVASLGKMNPDEPTPYIAHSIKFTVVATYPVFRTFLGDLQSSLALRDFAGVSFKSPTKDIKVEEKKIARDPAFDVYEYDVDLTTYSLR